MFLGLLVREREPYRDGHRGNLPSRVFLPISSFCFFPVSFRVVVLVSLPRNFTLLSIRCFSLRAFCSHGQRKMNGTHVLKFARR